MSRRPPSRGRVLPTSPFARKEYVPPSTADFSVGDRVTLDSWGMGRVIRVTEEEVVVDFGSAGHRRIPAGTKGFSRL
jgi:FKBP-type peptidyl-prolyl cis-trans isomerase 2